MTMNRRSFLGTVPVSMLGARAVVAQSGSGTGAQDSGGSFGGGTFGDRRQSAGPAGSQRYLHSVCRWCYGSTDLAELARRAREMRIASVELLSEPEWKVVQAEGLTCAVANGPTTISNGLNRTDLHDGIIKRSEELLPKVQAARIPSMIVFSGNRAGMSDDEGLKNTVAGMKRLAPLAEAAGVTIVMELLNSKVDHKDYMCDRTAWGVEVVKRVGSDRIKLLYDIYHMQIMEGDVIRTITDNIGAIGHFHTGGVPGRAEIDESQELNYTAICRAIDGLGYTGYIGQEFIPRSGKPMESLENAIRICTL